jgi:hypothetical protein
MGSGADSRSRAGCLYVAFGRPYLIQALNSIRTLRERSPGVAVCVLSNVLREPPTAFSDWNPSTDHWLYIDAADKDNRLYKTDLPRYTPFEKSLYIDSDTEILGDLTPSFEMLDYWDVAFTLKSEGYAPDRGKGQQPVLDGRRKVFELPHWNGGVFFFASNPRVVEFFALWNRYYRERDLPWDQVPLVDALFRSQCRLLSLDGRWNAGHDWCSDRSDQQRFILHYTFHVDDGLAARLEQLDREVFGAHEAAEPADGNSEVSRFVKGRQRIMARRSGGDRARSGGWRERLRRLRNKVRPQSTPHG